METPVFAGDEKAQLGFGVVAGALLLGLLGDVLLRVTPWGLNVLLWVAALGAVVGGLVWWQRVVVAGEGRWLIWLVVVFAATFAWRDSLMLHVVNGVGLAVMLILFALRFRAGQLREMDMAAYAAGVMHVGSQLITGSAKLFPADIRWQEIPRHHWGKPARAVGQGLLLSLPLVLLFGSLFAAADATFEQLSASFFAWLFSNFFVHLAVSGGVAWLVGGLLRQALLAPEWRPVEVTNPHWSLGIIELGVVLGTLNVLFFTFVVIQSRYFFGGLATVMTSPGLTVAEYARRGFFELVTVSALMLPLLLLADSLLRKERLRDEHIFRALADALVLQLFVIMASTAQRMWLYQSLYGLTELRFYTTVLMVWLAVVFVWFLLTILQGRRERFAFGALISAAGTIVLLNILNPDALIARTNLYRASTTAILDTRYVTSLSADAVPTLLTGMSSLDESTRRTLAAQLAVRWSAPTPQGWRTWNWSRWQASQLITHAALPDLIESARPNPPQL